MQSKLAILTVAVVVTACASPPPSQQRINSLLQSTVSAANVHASEGEIAEADILLHAVARVDPDYPGVAELRAKLGPEDRDSITHRGWLGINRRLRVREDRGFLVRLILYAPDRVFDVLDLVSVDVHVAFGALVDVHATRAVQALAGLRSLFGVGLHDQRSIGIVNEAETGFAALAFGAQTVSGTSLGVPAGIVTAADSNAGLHRPSDQLYQDYRDYWALGASVTAGLVGASVDFHPIQIFDLIGGVFLLDFARDDLATTRRLLFDPVEYDLLKELNALEHAGLGKTAAAQDPAEGAP